MIPPLTLIRVIDTETTDLDDPSELVEIGWTDVRWFGSSWEIESGPHARLVNPGMQIKFGAMATHHISQAEAETGISPAEARRLVTGGADYLCAHNAEFDRKYIPHPLPWICTHKCARRVWPTLQSHKNGAIRYELELCLDDPRAEPSHHAGPDTWVTAHILLRLLPLLTLQEMVTISRQPVVLLKIGFGEHKGVRFSDLPDGYLDWIVNKSEMPNDPKREDVVHTARLELKRRAQ
ncbi:exodeoxyribonuclease X [Mesorhizobium sp. NBSH29]|uniref:exodeoxyribonuclease X n=1 Tax=Mesorhizobium sp. NBSH29 TaxID=2654249 RepID=UPI0018969A26|nr:exodeoxyribonuclease X [Mesorhizobium sp. NBSH29]QPC87084.1 exodeoxyribonuclease X [Mesorhizobium sp. NBSH29]